MPAPVYMNSINRFSGDGVTTDWNINFAGGYLRRAHVKGIVTNADGTTVLRTLTIADPGDFIGPNQIRVSPAAVAGEIVVLFRDTPKDLPMVDFTDGSLISERNLDLIAQQAVFIAAEMVDRFGDTLEAVNVNVAAVNGALSAVTVAQANAAASAASAAAAVSAVSVIQGQITAFQSVLTAYQSVIDGIPAVVSQQVAAAFAELVTVSHAGPTGVPYDGQLWVRV